MRRLFYLWFSLNTLYVHRECGTQERVSYESSSTSFRPPWVAADSFAPLVGEIRLFRRICSRRYAGPAGDSSPIAPHRKTARQCFRGEMMGDGCGTEECPQARRL